MHSLPAKRKILLILAKSSWKQKLKSSRSALFCLKTRVSLKYFVNDCRYLPFPTSPFDISCAILISKSKDCPANELANQKKWLIVILKDFIKQPAINQSPTFSQFLFSHWLLYKCFFLFPYQSVCRFWKIGKTSFASFHCI